MVTKNIKQNTNRNNTTIRKNNTTVIQLINIISILIFLGIILNYNYFIRCINYFIKNELNNSYILTYGILGILILLTFIAYKYSKLVSGILFLIIMIIVKTYLNKQTLIEKFEDNLDEQIKKDNNYDLEVTEKVKDYLKQQVIDNPNITNLEKDVINDIYDTYFLNSDNLQILKRFNDEASDYNPINNEQQIQDILNFYQ